MKNQRSVEWVFELVVGRISSLLLRVAPLEGLGLERTDLLGFGVGLLAEAFGGFLSGERLGGVFGAHLGSLLHCVQLLLARRVAQTLRFLRVFLDELVNDRQRVLPLARLQLLAFLQHFQRLVRITHQVLCVFVVKPNRALLGIQLSYFLSFSLK